MPGRPHELSRCSVCAHLSCAGKRPREYEALCQNRVREGPPSTSQCPAWHLRYLLASSFKP
eukprot:5164821-Pleurochrysis_carterae.AAC.1